MLDALSGQKKSLNAVCKLLLCTLFFGFGLVPRPFFVPARKVLVRNVNARGNGLVLLKKVSQGKSK